MGTKPRPWQERIVGKFKMSHPDECWPWLAGKDSNGYGHMYDGQRQIRAHRLAWELFVGPIPSGLHIDHLCRNHSCVNPGHLEPVTSRENALRGVGPTAINARRTHCIRGHPYDEANTYWYKGMRRCRVCHAARSRRAHHGRKASE